MTHDETKGWIFSDEYHAILDARVEKTWRMTHERLGLYSGAFTIKDDKVSSKASARWPVPRSFERL